MFEDFGIQVLLEKSSAEQLGIIEESLDFDTLCKKSDFLVTLGGDGTSYLCSTSWF